MRFEGCRALWIAFALCGLALPAAAQDDSSCESDDDCEHGYSCEVTGGSGCATPDCGEGEDCPAIDCEPTETKSCVITRDCEADSDCLDGWSCNSYERERCDDVDAADRAPCEEGADCPEPEPAPPEEKASCEAETVNVCEPPWAGECAEDSDCGPGFSCEELIGHACSGSSGAPSSGGGAEPNPGDADGGADTPPGEGEADPVPAEEGGEKAESECTEEPTGEFYCRLIPTECSDDSDCDNGFTCESNPERPACGGATGGGDAGGDTPEDSAGTGGSSGGGEDPGAAPEPEADPDADARKAAEAEQTPCDESELPEKICLPPHYYDVGVDSAEGRGDVATAGSDSHDDGGGEEPPADPSDEDREGGSNSSSTEGEQSSGSGESAEEGDDGSCRAAGRGNAGSLGWLALAALALVRRRRA